MSEFKPLPPDTVISREDQTILMHQYVFMYKVEDFTKRIYNNLGLQDEEERKVWTEEGSECEVLMVGSTWKKGKVRIKIAVEFCEDSDTNTDELSVLRSQI